MDIRKAKGHNIMFPYKDYGLTELCHVPSTCVSEELVFFIASKDRNSRCLLYHIISYIYHTMSYHISCHVISYIMSYHISCQIIDNVMSYHISCHIIYHVMSYISCHIIYHVISYIMSCHIMSYQSYRVIISCHVIYHIMSYHIYHIRSYHISRHVMSYHISCHVIYLKFWYLSLRLHNVISQKAAVSICTATQASKILSEVCLHVCMCPNNNFWANWLISIKSFHISSSKCPVLVPMFQHYW
jgi:hypothetical protein